MDIKHQGWRGHWLLATVASALLVGCVGQVSPGDTSSSGPGQSGTTPAGGVAAPNYLRAMNNAEWGRAIHSALGVEPSAETLEALAGIGTAPNDPYSVSESLVAPELSRVQGWRTASERAAAQLLRAPAALTALQGAKTLSDADALSAVLTRAGRRLFRRPITAAELQSFVTLATKATPTTGQSVRSAHMEAGVAALLQSPSFLYRVEFARSQGKEDPYEVASKLAWVIWGDLPDDALLDAAGAGEIKSAALGPVIDRMLADPRAVERLAGFFEELFEVPMVARINPAVKPGTPAYDGAVADMTAELKAIFHDVVVEQGGGMNAALQTTKGYSTKRLAATYGADAEAHPEWSSPSNAAWLSLPPARAGVLTRAGWLTLKGNGASSNPIYRGAFITKRLLCQAIGLKDPGPARIENAAGNTTRERTKAVTTPCGNGCHQNGGEINAAGFALENFDGYGRYRVQEGTAPIDSSGSFAPLGAYKDAQDFGRVMAQSDVVHQCFAKQFVSAITYRPLLETPASIVTELASKSRSGQSPRELVRGLLMNPDFWKL